MSNKLATNPLTAVSAYFARLSYSALITRAIPVVTPISPQDC
ncbi:hypothetical protein ACEF00_01070 [Streptococcus hyovaginalis]